MLEHVTVNRAANNNQRVRLNSMIKMTKIAINKICDIGRALAQNKIYEYIRNLKSNIKNNISRILDFFQMLAREVTFKILMKVKNAKLVKSITSNYEVFRYQTYLIYSQKKWILNLLTETRKPPSIYSRLPYSYPYMDVLSSGPFCYPQCFVAMFTYMIQCT